MKKRTIKFYIFLTAITTALWFVGSWWHYTCNIKNTCGASTNTLAASSKNNSENTVNKPTNTTNIQVVDTDTDGLSDEEEKQLGTDPLLIDTDEDTIPDNEEIGISIASPLDTDLDGIIDALDSDDDNDGISTEIEERIGTSALHQDTDDDGINDDKEIGKNDSKPTDTDNDGIINALDTDDDDDSISTSNERLLGTNSLLLDTDGDGLSDAKELGENIESPLDSDKDGIIDALDTDEEVDQDGDGLSDSLEAKLNTNPTKADSDGDGIKDNIEVGKNTASPLDSDLDGIIDAIDTVDDSDFDNDTLTDANEAKLGSDPKSADSDNDGINDNEEIGKDLNDPLDTDGDGILNLLDKDDDNDKLSTRYEIRIGTNPLSDDSDNDGLKDNVEAKGLKEGKLQDTDQDKQINPVDSDDDNDGIPTSVEIANGTNPLHTDSDADGLSDKEEYGNNINSPLDSDQDGVIDALQPKQISIATKSPPKDEEEKASSNTTGGINNNDSQNIISKGLNLEFLNDKPQQEIKAARIYFPFLSANPASSDDVSTYIKEVALWMAKNPSNSITLTGHTDNVGTKKANLALGIKRVMVIREMLLDKGAPMNQIDVISRGEFDPIADNTTDNGRLTNRRVELIPEINIQN